MILNKLILNLCLSFFFYTLIEFAPLNTGCCLSLVSAQSLKNQKQLYEHAQQLYRSGKYEEAIAVWEQAIDNYQQTGNRLMEGYARVNISFAYFNIGNYSLAQGYAQQALEIARGIESPELESLALSSLANTLESSEIAIETLREAVSLARSSGKKRNEAQALRSLARAYASQGEYALAIENHELSLSISEAIDDGRERGRSYADLGSLYSTLGDFDAAIRNYQQAINIARRESDKSGEGSALLRLGNAYHRTYNFSAAKASWQEALQIAFDTGDVGLETIVLRALQSLDSDTVISRARENGNRSLEAFGWSSKGFDYQNIGRYDLALEAFEKSLLLYTQIGEREEIGNILALAGRVWSFKGNQGLAIIFLKESVNVRETIRSSNRTLSPDLQESYLGTVADDYRLLADLLLEQNRILEAQEVLELLKIEELREFTRATYTTDGIRYDSLEQEVVDAYGSLIALGVEISRCDPDCNQDIYDRQIALERSYDSTVAAFESAVRQNRTADDVYYDPRNLASDALDIVNAQPGTALIYPVVLEERLWLLWTATGGIVGSIEVTTANQTALNQAVLQFRELLKKPDAHSYREFKQVSQQLYSWLIQPLADEFEQNNIQQLVFAQDRTTRYLPMAALYDGQQYLIENYTVYTVLSAALTDTSDRLGDTDSARVLALGLDLPKPNFPALPNVREELDAVVKTDDDDSLGSYPGQVFMNDDFTFNTLSEQVRRHRILHIATHAEFVPQIKDASYILSGTGEPLTIADIGSLDTQFNNLHLVVLSACQTALGGEALDGTEIAGVSSYFLGPNKAEAVMATLWRVDDAGTSLLMQRFYELLATEQVTKAEALRQAQLSLLRQEETLEERFDELRLERGGFVNADTTSETSGLEHPYYWAPFVLIGNGL